MTMPPLERVLQRLPRVLSDHPLQLVSQTMPVPCRLRSSVLVGAYDIVVAHHEEDLQWLCRLPRSFRRLYLYHKGHASKTLVDYGVPAPVDPALLSVVEWIVLPNVGREGHTLVHHCLRCCDVRGDLFRYVHPTDTIVFAQTFDVRHLHTQIQLPPEQWEAYTMARDFVASRIVVTSPSDVHLQFSAVDQLHMQPSPHCSSLLEFAAWVFQRPLRLSDPPMCNTFGNCFGVRVRRIQRHVRALYERLMTELSVGINPMCGHFVERLSFTLFGDCEFESVSH